MSIYLHANINVYTLLIVVCSILIVIWLLWNNPFRETYINNSLRSKQKYKIEQFNNTVNKYTNAPNTANTPYTANTQNTLITETVNITQIVKYITLFQMYRDGIPDKYDTKGNTIKGISPDAHRAIQYARQAIRNGWGRWGLLEIAKMLNHGIHDFDPDLEKAKELYSYIIGTTRDSRLREEALELYQQVDYKIKQLHAYKWLNISPPGTKSDTVVTLTEQADQIIDTSTIQSPATQRVLQDLHIDRQQPIDIQNIIQQTDNQDGERIIIGENSPEPVDALRIKNDMQNVHDSTLLSTIRKSIENLQHVVTGDKLLSLEKVLTEVRMFLNTQPNNDKQRDALKALNAIERNVIPLASTQLKEVEGLRLVWSRIQSNPDEETRNQLKENLYTQLAECIEHGKPVCSTGRFTRIIDTLNVVDELVTIRPTFAIQQEMMDKCAKIRDDMLTTLPEQTKKVIDEDLNETNPETIEFSKSFKSTIREQLKKDYVDTGIWKQEKLNKELDKWIDFI